MNSADSHPFVQTLCWLHRFAGFPQSRLPAQAERLLLLAPAAQAEEANERERPSFHVKSRDVALESAQRQHAERRRRTHFKCDNSAKV